MRTTNIFKTVFLLFAFFVCGGNYTKAQEVVMATLQHGDNAQVFYGADGFLQAYEAASDGDLITLSGGTFEACDINKAIKIQGSGGFVQDASQNRYKTILKGDITIELAKGLKGLLIEGIYSPYVVKVIGSITEMTIKRCYINQLNLEEASTYNCNITQCQLAKFFPDAHSLNLVLSNCVFNMSGDNEKDAKLSIINCVQLDCIDFAPQAATYSYSIIYNGSTSPYVSYYYTAYCYYNRDKFTGPSPNAVRDHIWDYGSVVDYGGRGIFNLTSLFKKDSFYELTDANNEKLKDDFGRILGIYGGVNPFTNVPSNPQVVSKEIAGQSDANGKLSVKIIVEAQK